MKKHKILILGLFFCLGSISALLTTDLEANIPSNSCGGVGNCYYVPAGCGPGVGCKAYFCTSPSCPDSSPGPGDVCYKCVE